MQRIKVKKIEKKRLAKDLEAFLISRYYPDLKVQEYIVCLNYDFKTNTYFKEDILLRLDEAYKCFNSTINDLIMLQHKSLQITNKDEESQYASNL